MSFRAEVREFIRSQRKEKLVVNMMLSQICDLRRQNKDLMDRLMARNFEELKVYQTDESTTIPLTSQDLEPDEDEANAGDIVDG